jgi:DNA-binding transcriptional ArsR family regulator
VSTENNIERDVKLLSAMANEKRLQILKLISERELGVGELASLVGLSQSALSQHLAKLRADQLVVTRRDAQSIYYSTSHSGVCSILKTLSAMSRTEDQRHAS